MFTKSYLNSHLTINADDFGRDRATTDAVIDGFRHGIITCASIMVFGDDAARAARLAKREGLPLGLHVVASKAADAHLAQLDLLGIKPVFFNAHKYCLTNGREDRVYDIQYLGAQLEAVFVYHIKRFYNGAGFYGGPSLGGCAYHKIMDRIRRRLSNPKTRWISLHVSTDQEHEPCRWNCLQVVKSKEMIKLADQRNKVE